MMQGGLAPFTDILEVLCGGHLGQLCYRCPEEVTLVGVDLATGNGIKDGRVRHGTALIFTGRVILSLCSKARCWQIWSKIVKEDQNLMLIHGKLGYEFAADMCDYCAQTHMGVRGHRCSRCLTKVYSGEQCRGKDWGVHKLVCREKEVPVCSIIVPT